VRLRSWRLYFSDSYYVRDFYDIDRAAMEISCYTFDDKNHYEVWYYDGITDNWKRIEEFYNLHKAAIFADLYLMKLGYKIDKPFVIGDTDEEQEEGDGESP
jgi:hypothetical protein